MEDNTDKPRRPAKPVAEQKPAGSRSSVQTAGRRDERPAARSNSTDGQRRSDRPQGSAGGPRPQGTGYSGTGNRGPRPQGTGYQSRPQGSTGGPRPQGTGYSGTGNRGPRPQGAGDRPTPTGRPAPKQFDDKSDETEGLGLSETDDAQDVKVAHTPKKSDANYSMSYRGTSQRATGGRTTSPNRQAKKGPATGKANKAASQRQSMLNIHKSAPFKYDMNEILSQSSMAPDMASAFLATVIAKASRISTKECKEFVKTYLDDGYLTKDEFDKISKLMDRYSKYR